MSTTTPWQESLLTGIESAFHLVNSQRKVDSDVHGAQYDGRSFEDVCRDMFAQTLPLRKDAPERFNALHDTFAYIGGTNNPPDVVLGNKIAIECKKIEKDILDLQLNSSYPECEVEQTSTRIKRELRENTEVDWPLPLIYIVGKMNNMKIEQIWIVDGVFLAAPSSHYKSVLMKLKQVLETAEGIGNFADTKEIGRINNVDENANALRLRGMWLLTHPFKVLERSLASALDVESVKRESIKVVVALSKRITTQLDAGKLESLKLRLSENEGSVTKEITIKNPLAGQDAVEGLLLCSYFM